MPSFIVNNFDIIDFELLKKEFLVHVHDLTAKYQGKTIIDGPNFTVLDGNPKKMMVIIEFPSSTDLDNYLNSEKFKEIDVHRKAATEGWMIRVDNTITDKIDNWQFS